MRFAADHGLQVNEACKVLVALAVTALDARYYGLMRQLADVMGGANAFVRACVHVHAALAGARRATGRPLLREAERLPHIVATIEAALAENGLAVQTRGLWFLSDQETASEEPESSEMGRQPRRQPVRA
jgi:hypothetical protein